MTNSSQHSLRVYNLEIPLGSTDKALYRAVLRRLGLERHDVESIVLSQRALDARRGMVRWNCTADVVLVAAKAEGIRARITDYRNIGDVPEIPPLDFATGDKELRGRPVVVGSGPAGLFAAYLLARHGYKPLVIERGPPADIRLRAIGHFNSGNAALDPECNALFGEGGAGTFSDGKLYTRKNKDPHLSNVLRLLVEHGADPEIMIDAAPHIGTDKLAPVIVSMRKSIERMGGEYRFSTRCDGIEMDAQGIRALQAGSERIECGACILAIGHSARDTYRMLHAAGVAMEAKAFQFGVRIEHPQDMIDAIQYGRAARNPELGPAEYFLTCSANPELGEIHSFCMCPGGMIIPAVNNEGELCLNGMSFSLRHMKWANAGLVSTITPDTIPGSARNPLAGIEYQQRFEQAAFEAGGGDFVCPAQPAADFLTNQVWTRPLDGSYMRGRKYADLRAILPAGFPEALAYALTRFDRLMPGFASDQGIIHAFESRASSPVRISRDKQTRQSPTHPGLYPVGEGAGYAGGIMSAALDGMHSAMAMITTHRVPV